MAYTARELIAKSYYLSQVVSRELQTVSGSQEQDALALLNELLDIKGSDLRLIPYFRRDTFNTVAGQEEYFVENLLEIDAITFNLQSVRYPMLEETRSEYFGTARVDNLQSLPFTWHAERELGGMRVYLYYVPNQVYTVKYSGKFGLTDVTLDTDLTLTYDRYYIAYLRYALAQYICADWGVSFPGESQKKFEEIRKKLMDVSPTDLKMRKSSYFGYGPALNYAIVNISGGFVP